MSTKKTTPAPVEAPQIETDVEQLKKTVAYLETKVKSQSESIHLMKSMCDSCNGVVNELRRQVKKLSEISGA